ISNILGTNVQEIVDIINSDGLKEDVLYAVFEDDTFGDYAKEFNVNEYTEEKELLANIMNAKIADFILSVIEDGRVEYLRNDMLGDASIGNIVDLVFECNKEDGEWVINEDEAFKKVINTVFDVKINDIIDIVTGDNDDPVGYLLDTFGEIEIGDVADMFGIVTKTGKAWTMTDADYTVVSNVLGLSVQEIYDLVTDSEYIVTDTLETVFKEDTFEEYFEDFGLTEYTDEKEFLGNLKETKVAEFVNEMLGENVVDYMKGIFGEYALGNVVDLAIESEIKDGKWNIGETELPLIASDVLNVTVEDIIGWAKADEFDVVDVVATVTTDRSVWDYVDDIMTTYAEGIENEGLEKLLDGIVISEMVSLLVDGTTLDGEVPENDNVDGAAVANYVLNITDDIKIGDFFNVESENEIVKALLDMPLSYILYGAAVIVDPTLIESAMGDQKIGSLVGIEKYNEWFEAIDSSMTGDNDEGYVIEGSYKEIMEDVMNVTVGDIYNDIKDGTFVDEIKTLFTERQLGDYLYDTAKIIVGESEFNIGVEKEYAYENSHKEEIKKGKHGFKHTDDNTDNGYKLVGNFAVLTNKVFNIAINEMIESEDKVEYLKETFDGTKVGDVIFDLLRKFVNETVNFGIAQEFGCDNLEANDGMYVTAGNFRYILDQVLNFKLMSEMDEFGSIIENMKVGDVAFDLARKFLNEKLNLGIDHTFAYENYAENEGVYATHGNFKEIVDDIFNIDVTDVIDEITEGDI
ncbi:MAG: hypothetical protein MJ072_01850, partial [Clostridia bacterium]|nr:hypothetical protein [Clostridia bacterium]